MMLTEIKIEESKKENKKEFIVNELKEAFSIILYLAAAFCLLATFKALVLIQVNINEFAHLYCVAIVEALVLGKVVAIAQNFRLVKAWDKRALIWSVMYKSVVMTIIVYIANTIEEKIFAHHSNPALHPLIFACAHQIYLLFTFMVLYTATGLNRKLGRGTLVKLMIEK